MQGDKSVRKKNALLSFGPSHMKDNKSEPVKNIKTELKDFKSESKHFPSMRLPGKAGGVGWIANIFEQTLVT